MQDRATKMQGVLEVFHVRGRHNDEEENLSYHTVEFFTYSLISTRTSTNLKEGLHPWACSHTKVIIL